MPRNLCPEIRGRIVRQAQAGKSVAEIAVEIPCSEKTVRRWIRRFADGGDLALHDHRQTNRRPRKTRADEDQAIVAAVTDQPFGTIREITNAANVQVSERTVRRRLIEAGYRCIRPAHKIPLSPVHREQGAAFASENSTTSHEEQETIWTDEKDFESSIDCKPLVWQPKDQQLNPLDVAEEQVVWENAGLLKDLKDNIDPFDLIDEQFIKIFRLSKEAVIYLCDSLRCILQYKERKGISVETQVLAALRFLAVGSYQKGIGNDYLISLSQSVVSRAIKTVAVSITELLANEWIKFPQTEEKRTALKERFEQERNFKGVIGCIDCTHIAIVRPSHHEEAYINHKGFHSIKVQAIASQDLEILNINARFPGSVHDSFIWRYSAVRDEMIRLYDSGDRSTWLLGDADYSLEPWLMTPITDTSEGSAEARYTQCHTATRNCVERMFVVLKNVWRCLLSHDVLHYEPVMASNIITACAVLHNIRLHYKLMDKEYDIDEESEIAAMQRAALPENLETCNRIKAQVEEIDTDEKHLNSGNILLQAKRVQSRILRTQFGLRNYT